jgi:hypothetical protein
LYPYDQLKELRKEVHKEKQMMKARYRKIQAQILAKQELDARKAAKQKQKEEKAEYMQKLKQ